MHTTDGNEIELHNPVDLPPQERIAKIEEPWIDASIIVPEEYLGAILKLCEERRGVQKELNFSGNRAVITYQIP